MQENTKRIIKEDIEAIRAYSECFDVEMPDLDENGEVVGLPAPYPRMVEGVERSGYRVYELAKLAEERGIPIQNPILGRNDIEEHVRESNTMYSYAERFGETVLHFVHSEATRHLDPLKARELIEQSRGKGGVTPKGEREFVKRGGGSRHPIRINATGDMPHISILNALIAGFDMTDVGPVIHAHFGGRGIQDYRTKLVNGFKALQICAENNIYVQLDSQKHVNNIGGTPGMGLAMSLLAEGMAHLAGLPWELSCIQINIGSNNLYADQAVMRAFKEVMGSKALVVVPETFQNPPGNLIAEAAHFARMATSAMYGGAHFYRPKAAESVGIPTGESMGQAIWGTWEVFSHTVKIDLQHPDIDKRKAEIIDEAMAVLEAALEKDHLEPSMINDAFWESFTIDELIDRIVYAGKSGILDTERAGGWDLKRHVKVHRDKDGMVRYVPGYTPVGVDESRLQITKEEVHVVVEKEPTRPQKIVLATVGADAHVNGINLIRETFIDDGYEVIFLRGMNLPETVAEVAAEANADAIGVSNLLGMGQTLFPRVGQRLEELGLRDRVVIWAGGRVAEKEEEEKEISNRINTEGVGFLGVDAFFGPGSDPQDCLHTVEKLMRERKGKNE